MTGEDVANSLYYIHLDLPSDEHLAAPASAQVSSPLRASLDNPRSSGAIHRKPVPIGTAAAPKVESAGSRPSAAASHGERPEAWIPPGFKLEDSPTLDSAPPLPPRPIQQFPPPSASKPIQRKPLGPRPMDGIATPERSPPSSQPVNSPPRAYVSSSPRSPVRRNPYYDDPPQAAGPARPAPPASLRTTLSSPKAASSLGFSPFHLTVIRRDPSTGSQWNIGRVSSYQAENAVPGSGSLDAPSPAEHSPKARPAIDIHLESSGYAKFRGFPTKMGLEHKRPGSSASLPRSLARESSDETSMRGSSEGFNRQVVMSYAKSWTSNVREAFRRHGRRESSEDAVQFDLEPPRPPAMHNRSGSTHSAASVDSGRSSDGRDGADSPTIITSPGPGLKPRGYMFSSPWDGRCDFRTGNGGRSLKCFHTLNSSSAGYNPLVLVQGIRDGHGLGNGPLSAGAAQSSVVSELRFNLPSSDLFRKERVSRDLHSAFDKLLRNEHRHGSESEDEDEDPPAGFSLGREAAGGGNRGKRAKLGKLIIYDGGIKMLDLVVAANMGIWWCAWERRS